MRIIRNIIILLSIFVSILFGQINPIYKSDSIPLPYKDTIIIPEVPIIMGPFKETFFSFGVIGYGNYNTYKGSFGIFEKGISCSSFDGGRGFEISGGVLFGFNIFTDFSIQLRALLENKSGKMKSEYFLPIYNDRYAKTEHNLDIKLYYYSFDFLLKYNIISRLNIISGASFGLPRINKYQLSVKILSDEISYENDQEEKCFEESQIMNASKRFSLKFGLGFDIPFLSDYLFVSPELIYDHPMNNIVTDSEWRVGSFNIAIILKLEL
jgi:hypothetical protein